MELAEKYEDIQSQIEVDVATSNDGIQIEGTYIKLNVNYKLY